MLQTFRRHLPIVVTAFLTATVFAAGPTVAQAAYDAVNADKVDGKHAVGASATPASRAGKLVATNSSGRLPNNIIATAPNADTLDGLDSSGLVQGSGTLLTNRIVLQSTESTPEDPWAGRRVLLEIPGLGTLDAYCAPSGGFVIYENNTGGPVDLWSSTTAYEDRFVLPNGEKHQGFVHTNAGQNSAGTLSLGVGSDPGARRVATLRISALQPEVNSPCSFQVQGTVWSTP